MLIAQGTGTFRKGDVAIEVRASVLIDAGELVVNIEAPENGAGSPDGGTWALIDGEADLVTVADCTDDAELTLDLRVVDARVRALAAEAGGFVEAA